MDAAGHVAYVSLGTNLGDRVAHLAHALAALRATRGVTVEAVSPVYETDPVGPPGQGDYLNAVARLRTALAPRALLERLLAIEAERGRVRGERWGARSLDLDLLLYDDRCVDEPGLEVPHPRLHERPFVLVPLRDLAPDLPHPVLGRTVAELAESAGRTAHSAESCRPFAASIEAARAAAGGGGD